MNKRENCPARAAAGCSPRSYSCAAITIEALRAGNDQDAELMKTKRRFHKLCILIIPTSLWLALYCYRMPIVSGIVYAIAVVSSMPLHLCHCVSAIAVVIR